MTDHETVILHGRKQDYGAIINMMDDDIREELHSEMRVENPTAADNQVFLDAFLNVHEAKYGEEFDLN
jgi:hypothetical protein